jgi:DNA-binding response OmpR family regulator
VPGAKILLVDDSLTVQRVVEASLARAGYRIEVAHDLEEGLAAAHDFKPDLLLLDEPGQGAHLANTMNMIRAEPALRNTPIVILANREERLWEEVRRQEGVLDLIAKPFDPEVLVAAVEGVLHRNGISTSHRDRYPNPDELDVSSEDVVDVEELDEEWMIAERALRDLLGRVAAEALASRYGADPEVLAQQVARGISAPDLARRVAEVVWERPLLAQAASLDLIGDIAIIPAADLFRTLASREETGLLRIADAERRVEVTFRNGRIDFVAAAGLSEDFRLGRFVVEVGLMTGEALDEFLRTRGATNRLLGRQLVKLGYFDDDGLREVVRAQSCEILYELMRWTRGRFLFDRDRPPSELARESMLSVDVDPILLEGARRVEEWYLIERKVPHFDVVFTRNEEVFSEPALANLTRDEALLLDFVNGKATAKEIIQKSKRSTYDVARLLYRLSEARFIRPRILPIAIG